MTIAMGLGGGSFRLRAGAGLALMLVATIGALALLW
jgi:hypothetical protein